MNRITTPHIAGSFCAVIVLICSASDACFAQSQAEYGKSELLEIAQENRSAIGSIEVAFTFDAIVGPPSNPHTRHQTVATAAGDRVSFDTIYGPDPSFRDVLFRRQVAFDGTRSLVAEVHFGAASIQDGRLPECRTSGKGFFDIQLLNKPEGGHGYDDVSLVSLLSTPYSSIRASQEPVNGIDCHVVDLHHPETGNLLMSAWLDAARGALPLRTEIRLRARSDTVKVEYRIDEAVQCDSSSWIATRGRKIVHNLGTGHEMDQAYEFEMHVLCDSDGHPLLAINRPDLAPEAFDAAGLLVPGTEVRDLDSNEVWIATTGTVSDVVESYFAMRDYWGGSWPSPVPDRAPLVGSLTAVAQVPSALDTRVLQQKGAGSMRSFGAGDRQSPACGPAGLAVVYEHLGLDRDHPAFDNLDVLADQHGNTSFEQLAQHALSNGVHTYAGRLAPRELLKVSRPSILFCRSPQLLADSVGHFVVCLGPMSERSVMVFDPIGGTGLRGEVSLESLARIWTGDALVFSAMPMTPALDSTSTSTTVEPVEEHYSADKRSWFVGIGVALLVGALMLRFLWMPSTCLRSV